MAKASLARLRDLYEAALPQSDLEDGVVEVVIRKAQQIDFLPIVDEARRVLDDGNQEFAPVDLSQISVPTEKAALFAGRTTVTPSPKRRIRQVAAPVEKPEPHHHYEDEPEESIAATSSPRSLTGTSHRSPLRFRSRPKKPRHQDEAGRAHKPAVASKPKKAAKPAAKRPPVEGEGQACGEERLAPLEGRPRPAAARPGSGAPADPLPAHPASSLESRYAQSNGSGSGSDPISGGAP